MACSDTLVAVAVLTAAGMLLTLAGGYAGGELASVMRAGFDNVATNDDVWVALRDSGIVAGRLLVVFAVVVFAIAALATWIQTGPLFSVAAVAPDFSRLRPGASLDGTGRFSRVAIAGIKFLLIAVGVGAVLTHLLDSQSQSFARLVSRSPLEIAQFSGAMIMKFAVLAGGVLAVIAVADLVTVKWSWWARHHMTRQEVLADRRRDQVDPRIRRARQRLGREISTESDPPRSANP